MVGLSPLYVWVSTLPMVLLSSTVGWLGWVATEKVAAMTQEYSVRLLGY
jgi:hypothetical protein